MGSALKTAMQREAVALRASTPRGPSRTLVPASENRAPSQVDKKSPAAQPRSEIARFVTVASSLFSMEPRRPYAAFLASHGTFVRSRGTDPRRGEDKDVQTASLATCKFRSTGSQCPEEKAGTGTVEEFLSRVLPVVETLLSGKVVSKRTISDPDVLVEKRVDWETVITGDMNGNVKIWRHNTAIFCTSELILEDISAHTGPVVSLDVRGDQVASLDATGVVCVWKISDQHKLALREISSVPPGEIFRHLVFTEETSTLLGGESGLRRGEEQISDLPVASLTRLGSKVRVEYISGEVELIDS